AWVVASALRSHPSSVPLLGAAATALALAIAVLGTEKANDGVDSIFFPYARVYLGLPWMLCGLALLPPPRPPSSDARRAGAVALLLLLVLGSAGAVAREVHLGSRVEALVADADGVPPVAPASTA